MAEKKAEKKAEKEKDEQAPAAAPAKAGRKLPMKLILIVAAAVVQGALLFAVTKMFGGGPQSAHGQEAGHEDVLEGPNPADTPKSIEFELLKAFRVPNESRGRLYIYDLDISVKVAAQRKADMDLLVTERRAELADRVAAIVRSATPDVLNEPELKTLRMKFKYAIGAVADDTDLVLEVLIPRCVPIPT